MTSREALIKAITEGIFKTIHNAGYKLVPRIGVGSENPSYHGVEIVEVEEIVEVDDSRWKV